MSITSGHFTLHTHSYPYSHITDLGCVCGGSTRNADEFAVFREEHADCVDPFTPAAQLLADSAGCEMTEIRWQWAGVPPFIQHPDGWRCSVYMPTTGHGFSGKGDTKNDAMLAMLDDVRERIAAVAA